MPVAKANSGGIQQLNHEIEVKYVGEPIRVKPFEDISGNREPYLLWNNDQYLSAIITKTIHLYKKLPKGYNGSVSKLIGESLPKVLSHYYPLAGKFGMSAEGKLIVECTDEGVILTEANANCVLDDLLPWLDDTDTMHKFVYDAEATNNVLEHPLMTVQVTRFLCGGLAVAIAMNHGMSDGISEGEFFNNWSRIARGLPPLDTPSFLDRAIFSPATKPTTPLHPGFLRMKETIKTESIYDDQPLEYGSFVFDEEKISRLKGMATEEGSGVSQCSTFEVLTAFLWRARTKAFNVESNKQVMVIFTVDVRSKLNPPLPKGFLGNAAATSNSLCNAGDLLEKNLSYGVKLIQDAKSMVNDDYARSFIYGFDLSMIQQSLTTTLGITSWCNLGLDEMDFGWGKAVYAGPAVLPMKESAVYIPYGKNKKGVIIKMGLPRLVMKIFEELVMQI